MSRGTNNNNNHGLMWAAAPLAYIVDSYSASCPGHVNRSCHVTMLGYPHTPPPSRASIWQINAECACLQKEVRDKNEGFPCDDDDADKCLATPSLVTQVVKDGGMIRERDWCLAPSKSVNKRMPDRWSWAVSGQSASRWVKLALQRLEK